MKIAVEGCAHGELDNIYATIKEIEGKENIKIDLLICCGDFQSSRNEGDLKCMAVPLKYSHMCSFYKYYGGEKKAPILTIFIGGNHEASNYLQELPYGGWVAPNIYYLGYAGVIDIAGLRIGGLSGIYKGRDFLKGHFEKVPYNEDMKRSVYHVRNLEVFRLKQLSQPMDIFLSHDWPSGVYNFGNKAQLLKRKPFFRDEVESNQLGSKPCEELLNHLKPKYWFAAHLHCKFAALVPHEDESATKFLALDKCLPKRKFLQVVDIPHDGNKKIEISYDLEWLTVLYLTNHLLNVRTSMSYMPGPGGRERYDFTPSQDEKSHILNRLNNTLKLPKNFRPTANVYQSNSPTKKKGLHNVKQPEAKLNPQTVELCELLSIDDPICLVSENNGQNLSLDESLLENTTFISDSDDVSETLNDSEINIETDLVKQEAKIKDLKLPEPKNLESIFLSDVEDHKLGQKINRMTPLKLPKPVNKESESMSVESEVLKEANDSEPSQKSDSITPLKLPKPVNEGSEIQSVDSETTNEDMSDDSDQNEKGDDVMIQKLPDPVEEETELVEKDTKATDQTAAEIRDQKVNQIVEQMVFGTMIQKASETKNAETTDQKVPETMNHVSGKMDQKDSESIDQVFETTQKGSEADSDESEKKGRGSESTDLKRNFMVLESRDSDMGSSPNSKEFGKDPPISCSELGIAKDSETNKSKSSSENKIVMIVDSSEETVNILVSENDPTESENFEQGNSGDGKNIALSGENLIVDEEQSKSSPKRTFDNAETECSENSDKVLSTVCNESTEKIEEESGTPTPKKFKRRNAGIYS